MNITIISANIILLIISTLYDLKYKKIPNKCILFMLSVFCLTHAVSVIITGTSPGMYMVFKCTAGAIVPFFLMLPAELLTNKSFGAGDKKLLFVLGLSTGVWGIVIVMLVMLSGGLLYGVIKKVKKGEYIAMAPFILVSYCVFVLNIVIMGGLW